MKGTVLKLVGFLKGGVSRRKAPRQRKGINLRRDASPAFGNPARSRLLTSVGFAALVHTRCAFIVSGAASKNSHQRFDRCNWQLNNLDQPCQALLILWTINWQLPAITIPSKIETYCQRNGQRPPLSRFCNNFIMLLLVLDEFLNMPFLTTSGQTE